MRQFWARCNVVRLVAPCFLVGLLAPFAMPLSVRAVNPPPVGSTITTGIFFTIYGDPPPGSNSMGSELYFIADDQGVQTQLDISEQVLRAAGGVLALDRQRVTVVATTAPSTVAPNGAAPVMTVSSISLANSTQTGDGSSAPSTSLMAPADVHVTGTTSTTVSFGWTPQDPTSGIAVSNGAEVIDLGVAGSSYTQSGMISGDWACISIAAYNASGASGYTGWACGQAV